MGYRIAMGVVVLLFLTACYGAYAGWGLSSTAETTAQQQQAIRSRSARIGYIGGGGPRFGK